MGGLSIAVLSGGRSSEHQVSLASGLAVSAGLTEAGHLPTLIEVDRTGVWMRDGQEVAVVPGRGLEGFDAVFPVIHGPFGEDGTLQGLLESLNIPYVGSGVFASAVCIDKLRTKEALAHAGFKQVAFEGVTAHSWAADRAAAKARIEALGLPVWVKPARLGSSVGITRVDALDQLDLAIEAALTHDPRVIVEESSPGREIEVSILERLDQSGGFELIASSPGEITLPEAKEGDWYDFERKYEAGGMTLSVPADLLPEVTESVRATALEAFSTLGLSGYARVDCFVTGDEVAINEINTAPGFTSTSVFAQLFAADGINYPELLAMLVDTAVEQHRLLAGFSF
jgi:D-alanine-D-alanine ligase